MKQYELEMFPEEVQKLWLELVGGDLENFVHSGKDRNGKPMILWGRPFGDEVFNLLFKRQTDNFASEFFFPGDSKTSFFEDEFIRTIKLRAFK